MKFIAVVYVMTIGSSLLVYRCGSITAPSVSTPMQLERSPTTPTERPLGTGGTAAMSDRSGSGWSTDRPAPSNLPNNYTMGYNGTVIDDDNGSSVPFFSRQDANSTMYTPNRGHAGIKATPTVTLSSYSSSISPLQLGRCEIYNAGSICQQYMSNQTVFVDPDTKYSQDKMATFLSHLLIKLNSTLGVGTQSLWTTCYNQLEEALCRYFFPNCSTTPSGDIVRALTCRESCVEIFLDRTKRCTKTLITAAGAAIVYARQEEFKPAHVDSGEFACSHTILPNKIESNYTCQDLLSSTSTEITLSTAVLTAPPVIYTCNGTSTEGSHCAFPFVYRGVTYTKCTVVNSVDTWKPWCALKTGNFDLHRQWGYCDCTDNTPGKPDAECEIYQGGDVCAPYRSGKNVFVDLNYNQSYLGRVAVDAINRSLWEQTQDNLECRYTSLETVCYMVFPNCITRPSDGASLPVRFCRETCNYLVSTSNRCTSTILKLLNVYTSFFSQSMLNPVHIYVAVPECDSLPSNNQPEALCAQLSTSKRYSSEPNTMSIVSVAVPSIVGVTILSFVVGLFLWLRQSKRKRLSMNDSYVPATDFMSLQKFEKSDERRKCSVQEVLKLRSSKLSTLQINVPHFPIDQIKYIQSLGQGNFGQVYLGTADIDCSGKDTKVAVKVLKQGSGDDVQEDFEKELLAMAQLSHPNILRLLARYVEDEPYCMVFEFMRLGDLHRFLRLTQIGTCRYIPDDDVPLPDSDISIESKLFAVTIADLCNIVKQVCCGLAYLGKEKLVHRDIATRNCLVGEDLVTKIADFGLSRNVYTSDYYRISGGSMLPIRWMAPESITYGKFTIKSDVWSFGVLVWEVFTLGKQPYYGLSNEEVITNVRNGATLPSPDDFCPDTMRLVMKQCWTQTPEERPDAESLLSLLEETRQIS